MSTKKTTQQRFWDVEAVMNDGTTKSFGYRNCSMASARTRALCRKDVNRIALVSPMTQFGFENYYGIVQRM